MKDEISSQDTHAQPRTAQAAVHKQLEHVHEVAGGHDARPRERESERARGRRRRRAAAPARARARRLFADNGVV